LERINFVISREIQKDLNKDINFGRAIRIKTEVKFKQMKSWSRSFFAIIDTGAYISLLPHDVWKNADVEIIGTNYWLRGLVPNSKFPVKLGRVKCVLLDSKLNISDGIGMLAFLSDSEQMPLILGFKDVLEKIKMFIDCKNNEAYIEE